jgi:hypothetical protein
MVKDECTLRGLSSRGTKADCITRLVKHDLKSIAVLQKGATEKSSQI